MASPNGVVCVLLVLVCSSEVFGKTVDNHRNKRTVAGGTGVSCENVKPFFDVRNISLPPLDNPKGECVVFVLLTQIKVTTIASLGLEVKKKKKRKYRLRKSCQKCFISCRLIHVLFKNWQTNWRFIIIGVACYIVDMVSGFQILPCVLHLESDGDLSNLPTTKLHSASTVNCFAPIKYIMFTL